VALVIHGELVLVLDQGLREKTIPPRELGSGWGSHIMWCLLLKGGHRPVDACKCAKGAIWSIWTEEYRREEAPR